MMWRDSTVKRRFSEGYAKKGGKSWMILLLADITDEKSIDSDFFKRVCHMLNCLNNLNILSSCDEEVLKCTSEGICLLLWHTMNVYGFFY
jgi:hypothetical protein